MRFTAYRKYLWQVLRHKWFVFVECCREGIPFRGIVHDWTKFLPSEFDAYAMSFYGPESRREDMAFKLAWKGHQKFHPHHWQHWVLWNDSGFVEALPMSDEARREMLADWRGAGKAYADYEGKVYDAQSTKKWYLDRKEKKAMLLHDETRAWIEERLGVPPDYGKVSNHKKQLHYVAKKGSAP